MWDYASAASHTLPDMNPAAADALDAAAIAKVKISTGHTHTYTDRE